MIHNNPEMHITVSFVDKNNTSDIVVCTFPLFKPAPATVWIYPSKLIYKCQNLYFRKALFINRGNIPIITVSILVLIYLCLIPNLNRNPKSLMYLTVNVHYSIIYSKNKHPPNNREYVPSLNLFFPQAPMWKWPQRTICKCRNPQYSIIFFQNKKTP